MQAREAVRDADGVFGEEGGLVVAGYTLIEQGAQLGECLNHGFGRFSDYSDVVNVKKATRADGFFSERSKKLNRPQNPANPKIRRIRGSDNYGT
ncbi:hypothetical protein GCM10023172_31300 [Hymenobacter ginsengisoli]|uniref:Uncharacterized protein n=1 Tax=Hymenobacter ginsengisoli TaxID=1051626 RepID=A0ABP8QLZ8_9BACT